ncbi:unnamed protein product [Arctogadus glacialis]
MKLPKGSQMQSAHVLYTLRVIKGIKPQLSGERVSTHEEEEEDKEECRQDVATQPATREGGDAAVRRPHAAAERQRRRAVSPESRLR